MLTATSRWEYYSIYPLIVRMNIPGPKCREFSMHRGEEEIREVALMRDLRPSGIVAIVGLGAVGASSACALMNTVAASEIILISRDGAKIAGEVMDLNHGSSFVPPVKIRSGSYEDCGAARIVIVTAGVRQQPGESRMNLLERNLAVMQEVIPGIIAYNRDCIILKVTNPVDAMTYAALKLSGLPRARIIGPGTLLDTSRFRFLLGQHCGVAIKNVHACITGEHGDSETAAWSTTSIAGAPFELFCEGCPRECTTTDKEALFDEAKNAAYEIIEKKGASYYAISLAARRIVHTILRDESVVLPVSTLLNGEYGVTDVCVSLPCIVGAGGIKRVFALALSEREAGDFRTSAASLGANLRKVAL